MVVGLGGVGSLAAEMLARCGIGKMILVDFDVVEEANMNRPCHVGMKKCFASQRILAEINEDVCVETLDIDVTKLESFELLLKTLRNDSKCLVLSCVDNYEARLSINQACNELNISWIESGVNENAMSGHVQLIIPGLTACYLCAPPLCTILKNESTLKRDGVCTASLPTTMAIIAGLLVQNALKFLLQFGTLSYCLSYQGISNYFSEYMLKPNKECMNAACIERQKESKNRSLENPKKEMVEQSSTIENEYGIVIENGDIKEEIWEQNIQPNDLDELRNKLNLLNKTDQ